MSDEWGPWIEHDGGRCPVVGYYGQYQYSDGDIIERVAEGFPQAWVWSFPGCNWPQVIRYRIRKPRALEQLREIARNPERELEDV